MGVFVNLCPEKLPYNNEGSELLYIGKVLNTMDFLSNLFGSGLPGSLNSQQKGEVGKLTDELVKIGREEDFLSEHPGGAFDGHCHHIRARAIGRRLSDLGGVALLQAVHQRVRRKLGKQGRILVSHLDYAWKEIGDWKA